MASTLADLSDDPRMWRIAWNVIVRLVEILVALAMLGAAQTAFETILISALIFIYVTIVGAVVTFAQAINHLSNQNLSRYIALARALRIDADVEAEALAENQSQKEKYAPAVWIGIVSRGVLALIALFALIRVL